MSNAPTYFSIDILFGEALEFDLEEIAAAVSTDYPEAGVIVHPVNTGKSIRTDKTVLGLLKPADPRNGHVIVMNGTGKPDEEFRAADHSEIAWRSGGFAHFALNAIKNHESYMTLSIQTSDPSLKGQFRAVRQLMAVAAVFAELPISLAVLVHGSSHMLAPAEWVKQTHNAMRGEWPLSAWISFRCGWEAGGTDGTGFSVGHSKGLRHFLGVESHITGAPIAPSSARTLLRNICLKLLEDGKEPLDRDIIQLAGDPLRYKIRRPQAGNGALGPVVLIVHPDAANRATGRLVQTMPHENAAPHDGSPRPNPDFMKAVLARTLQQSEIESSSTAANAQDAEPQSKKPPCRRAHRRVRSCSGPTKIRAAS